MEHKKIRLWVSQKLLAGALWIAGVLVNWRKSLLPQWKQPDFDEVLPEEGQVFEDNWSLCREKVMKSIHLYNPSAEELDMLSAYCEAKARMKRLITKAVEKEEWENIKKNLE